jgi:hypothetical protein
VQLPLVATCTRVLAGLGAPATLRTAEVICLRVQQRIQRLFHRAAHYFSEVSLYLPLINLNHLAELGYLLVCFSLVGGLHRPSS